MLIDASMAKHVLPFPLAVLHDPLTVPGAEDRLPSMLVFAEGAAHFLAWILVADAAASQMSAKALKSRMKSRSFGHYLHAIDECLAERAARTDRFLPELDALARGEVRAFLDRAASVRNATAHHRIALGSMEARRALDELEPGLAALRDALSIFSAHPLGMMRRVSPQYDGTQEGEWVTLRGLSLYNGHATIERADGIPEKIVVLVDTQRRRALSLHPFFLCDGRTFAWLELPLDGDKGVASYRMLRAEQSGGDHPQRGIADPTGRNQAGLSLDEWLANPRLRPRHIELAFGAEALAEIQRRANPTHMGELRAPSPAALRPQAPHAPDARLPTPLPPPTPEPTRVLPFAPSPPVHPPWQPPVNPTVYLPPPPPSLPPPAVRSSSIRDGAGIIPWLVGGGGLSALAVALLVMSSRARSSAVPTESAPPSRASVAPDRSTVVSSYPELAAWLSAWWPGHPTRPLNDADLLPRYAPRVSFHGRSADQDPASIAYRWRERLAQNRFSIDLDRSHWSSEPEAERNVPAACRAVAGATPGVTKVLLHAVEEGTPIADPRGANCARVEGQYILRLRAVGGRWVICHETWHRDALCGSCPAFCARR